MLNGRVIALTAVLCLISRLYAPCHAGDASEARRCTADLVALPTFLLENDSGAKDAMDRLGAAHFDAALASAKSRAGDAADSKTCREILNAYLKAWRKGHLAVTGLSLSEADTSSGASGLSESPFPALEALSRKTLLLRIPSFEGKYRDALAHLIGEKRGELMDHEDWIVDVRGNQGGSDSTYEALLPWLLPDEYEDVGAKWLVTPANIEGQRNVCKLMAPGDKVCESYSAQAVQRMEGAAAGTYVSQEPGPEIHYRRIAHPESVGRPKRVAVLFDKGCGSSCEEFLLTVRQSFNVKLLGRPSHGSLDYSNLRPYTLPSHERLLWYATSRSDRLPDLPVDVMGIQPDIFLPHPASESGDEGEVHQVQGWLERGVLAATEP